MGFDVAATARRYLDAKSVLTLFLVLSFVPSYLTITVVGSVGRPVTLLSLGMLAWWMAHQLQRPFAHGTGSQVLRWLLVAFVVSILGSYISAMFRGIPLPETSPADNGLLRAGAWCGIFLVAHDGLRSWESILVTLRRIVVAVGLMAGLGLLQFVTKNSLLGWFSIPGMSGDGIGGIDTRSGFVRAAGTAAHPLEYGMLLCLALPLSLTLAMEDQERTVLARWWPTLVIAAASILSVSRSALIAVVVAMAVLSLSWTMRQRGIAIGITVVLLGVVYAAVPGMAGTLVGMFTGAAQDSSVASRINSYDVAFGMVGRLPVFGRGFGTLLPSYVYLDNQYLGVVIELGLVGLAVVLTLFASGALVAWLSRKAASTRLEHQMGAALASAVCAGAVSFTFFDALSFPLSSAFMFFVLGISGAYRRVMREETIRPDDEPVSSIGPTLTQRINS